jgi:hypothetical protein
VLLGERERSGENDRERRGDGAREERRDVSDERLDLVSNGDIAHRS